jgi:hypothetical protein
MFKTLQKRINNYLTEMLDSLQCLNDNLKRLNEIETRLDKYEQFNVEVAKLLADFAPRIDLNTLANREMLEILVEKGIVDIEKLKEKKNQLLN